MTVDRAIAPDQHPGHQHERLAGRAHDDHLPADAKTPERGGHCARARDRRQDRRRAAEARKRFCNVLGLAVDVVVGAEPAGELLLLLAARDRRRLEAEPHSELNAQMSETADAQDRDKPSGARTAAPQRVERRHARAHQGRRLLGSEIVRYPRQRRRPADEVVRVAAVGGHTRYRLVLAIDEVATPAGFAVAAVAAEPADADPLTHRPPVDSVADRVHDPGHLVPGHNRIADTGEVPFLGIGVAVANAARLHPDADLARSRLRNLPLAKLERTPGLGYLDNSHRARLERVRAHYLPRVAVGSR